MARRTETCRIAAEPADYERYGITQAHIAPWEDGFRTDPGGPGTFEWWYFDAVLEDGSTLVINFMVKDIRGGGGISQPARPVVTFELDRPDGVHVERQFHADSDFAFAADRCDVRVGANTFAGDLHAYRIRIDIDGVAADVTLTGEVPAWRPETGHIVFGEDEPHLFAWLPSVPQGSVTATLTVDGETRTLSGTGYHDHNWGDTDMPRLIHHWYWARAQAGDYCVIASNITAEHRYGLAEMPIFLLARDGKILADDSRIVRFRAADEHPDPVTGKPVAFTTTYDYDATAHGGEHYRVTFRRDNTIVQERMIDSITGPKHVLAKLAGFDGAYMRFTGQVSVERVGSDASAEAVSAPALWELMYFGKTQR
jgi:CrtC N-terminal lipocalin domain